MLRNRRVFLDLPVLPFASEAEWCQPLKAFYHSDNQYCSIPTQGIRLCSPLQNPAPVLCIPCWRKLRQKAFHRDLNIYRLSSAAYEILSLTGKFHPWTQHIFPCLFLNSFHLSTCQ